MYAYIYDNSIVQTKCARARACWRACVRIGGARSTMRRVGFMAFEMCARMCVECRVRARSHRAAFLLYGRLYALAYIIVYGVSYGVLWWSACVECVCMWICVHCGWLAERGTETETGRERERTATALEGRCGVACDACVRCACVYVLCVCACVYVRILMRMRLRNTRARASVQLARGQRSDQRPRRAGQRD